MNKKGTKSIRRPTGKLKGRDRKRKIELNKEKCMLSGRRKKAEEKRKKREF